MLEAIRDGRISATIPKPNVVVPLAGLAFLAMATWLYHAAPGAYGHILQALMLRPFPHPFIDWEFMPTAITCWHKGVDVYQDNTCYTPVPHGQFNYSPLWLRAWFLPDGRRWINLFGLGFGVAFFAALATLPSQRSLRDLSVTALASLSSLVTFAIERANVDIVIFLLAVLGGHLLTGRLFARLGGYGAFLFAGLLKFYPLVLMVTVLRERLRTAIILGALALVIMAALAASFQTELSHVGKAIPAGSYFTDLFGAVDLPYGLSQLITVAAGALGVGGYAATVVLGHVLPVLLLGILFAGALVCAVILSERHSVRAAFAALPIREGGLLTVGAVLVCGCFFVGQSVGYRGIFLLLVLPGLLRLSHDAKSKTLRGIARHTCWAVVFVMWVLSLQWSFVAAGLARETIAYDSPIGLVHWLLHELAWWWIVTVLLSVLYSFMMDSAASRDLRALAGNVARRRFGRTA
jgi:hypothetical protein